jgi:hypothetical protein
MARLASSKINGNPDPQLAFGIENLETPANDRLRLDADLYIEAFGSRITRPRKANYGMMTDDLPDLITWLNQYLEKTTDVHRPFSTMEPAFELKFEPASGATTWVSARIQAYGTVDQYFDTETGPAMIFETTNQAILEFKQQLMGELRVLND